MGEIVLESVRTAVLVGFLGGVLSLAAGLVRWFGPGRRAGGGKAERLRAAEALSESEARYRAIVEDQTESLSLAQFSVDRVTDALYWISSDARFFYVNDAACAALGHSRDELLQMTALDISPEFPPEMWPRHWQEMKEKGTVTMETVHRRKDGTVFPVEISANFLEYGGEEYNLAFVRDITARKQAEEAAGQSEARLNAFFTTAPAGLAVFDEHGRYVRINETLADINGASPDEHVGKRPREVIGVDFAERIEDGVDRVLETGEAAINREASGEVPGGAGVPRHFVFSHFPIPGAGAKPIGVGSIVVDVSEWKRAEQALGANEARLAHAEAMGHMGSFDRNISTGELIWSEETYRILGLVPDGRSPTLETFLNCVHPDDRARVHLNCVHPDGRARVQETLEEAAATGSDYESDFRIVRPDGAVRIVHSRGQFEFDPSGAVTRLRGAVQDVTDLKRAEDALRENETHLRQIIDLVPHMIFAKDRDGRFVLANRAAAAAYGREVEDLIGLSQGDLHPEKKDLEQFFASDREVIDSGKPTINYEQEFTDGLGRTRITEISKIPIAMPGTNKPAVLGVSVDITERKQAEERLRQAQKMEAVGQLTGGIAHDFNNLLTVILGNVQLLQREVGEDQESWRLAEMAIEATKRGADLTHRLLAFSRQQPLESKVVDLNRLIGDTSRLLSRTLGEPIDVALMRSEGLWETLADPAQVQNAILNLAINASHAMPKGGTVTIGTANVAVDEKLSAELDGLAPGDYVALSVGDAGIGMAPAVVDRAFDPFFTTKEVGEGSGLGLSMVYGFAKQSGGHARIDSEEGKGTTVTIYLPRSDRQAEALPEKAEPGADIRGKEAVLVVEDNAEVRSIAIEHLSSRGYRIAAARDALEALAMLRNGCDADVLFTDVVLPKGMSGTDLARAARGLRPGLKVLFTSGNAKLERGRDYAPADGSAFLPKPYMGQELAVAMRSLIEN